MAAVTPHWRINYLEIGMKYTRNLHMRAVADRTLLCALPAILLVGALELIVKNAVFILANIVIAIINGGSYLVHRIKALYAARRPTPPLMATPAVQPQGPNVHPVRVPQRNDRPVRVPQHIGGARINLNRLQPLAVVEQRPPLDAQQFTPDELGAFRASLMSSTNPDEAEIIQLEDTLYAVWHEPRTNSILIQTAVDYHARNENNRIEVMVDEPGRITSIKINGVNQNQIPADFLPRFQQSFLKCLELSSKYDFPNIQIIRRGLKEIPHFHMEKLAEAIMENPGRQNFASRISVVFLKNNLTRDEGYDAGGLSREFVDDLFKYITGDKSPLRFSKNPNTGLLMPVAQLNSHGVLNFNEQKTYRHMGQVMMYCYLNQNNMLIGKRFDNHLFRAAFSLTPAEVDMEYALLADAVKLKMCLVLARANDEPAASIRYIELAAKGNLITHDELREVVQYLDLSGDLPQGINANLFDPANAQQRVLVQHALVNSIFSKERVGESLAAIHAIARGMKQALAAIQPRTPYQGINPAEFERKVQGSLDRAVIAERIIPGPLVNRVVRQKIDWLKEWIRDETTTEEELHKFVKFVSGSSSLAPDQRIDVAEQSAHDSLPVPVAHTCFLRIDISPVNATYGGHNDHNKANFIRALRELALTDPTGYSMA
jgi:hypothetical protein